ncbi:MAG: CapA family protein [Tangfeifania sp.]
MIQTEENKSDNLKFFLCGDVMTGRGIDQALPFSVEPVLYESYVKDARAYLELAERENGNIDTPVSYDYIWGDALDALQKNNPDIRMINLETSITTHSEPWPGKGINYRMHPRNVEVLTAAGTDHCSLANNHTLDWSRPGLAETMETLKLAGIRFSGVGNNEREAGAPSVFKTRHGRVLVLSVGSQTSGIPLSWEAEEGRPGVNLLPGLDAGGIRMVKQQVEATKEPGDVVVVSIHWGGNWGYAISDEQREFAYRLIDEAGVDVIYGHSSHHPQGIEVYSDKLIIYGAGDFINDYEGISGHEQYRGELTLMYFPEFEPETGKLKALKMIPMEISRLRLNYAKDADAKWLQQVLHRESRKLGAGIRPDIDNTLWLEW